MAALVSTLPLVNRHNVKLNRKGAMCFESTSNPVLDLFTYTSKQFYQDRDQFNNVVDMIVQAKNYDSILFLKLLKFSRLIEEGNGIKNIYYLCLLVLKEEDKVMYESMLQFSYEYPKDLLTMAKLSSSFSPMASTDQSTVIKRPQYSQPNYSQGSKRAKIEAYMHRVQDKLISNDEISLSFEIKLYGDLIYSTFLALLSGSSEYNPMLLKYLSYETGHFSVEAELIWEYLKQILDANRIQFDALVDADTELGNELAVALRLNLRANKSSGYITNKNKRKLKKLFNGFVNLADCLYKGFHSDGTQFGSKDRNEEVEMIYQVISKTPTISSEKLKNFIRNIRKDNVESMSLRDTLLVAAYDRYIKRVAENKVQVKTHGLDLSYRCMEFYQSSKSDDPELESQLTEMCAGIDKYLRPCFSDDFTFSMFAEKLVLILDVSGSMGGKPINTGLLYFVIMAKIFKVAELYYFSDSCFTRHLNESDLNGSFCNLIKKVYTLTMGSTVLQAAFDTLEATKKSNQHVVLLTDGDCDPVENNSNPFHLVTTPGEYQYLHLNESYTVVNVSQTKMNFPYVGLDPKVCYVTGNNPKTLSGLIKSLIMSANLKVPITPELVLKNSLDMECLDLPCLPANPYHMILSDEQKDLLFQVIKSNLPPTNTSKMQMDTDDFSDDHE